ncbi:MAG: ribosome small subunit-dependent GTPase A [Parachlamydiales bacterium]|nr:ribosome small subunit-dependent GTPase A [Parachlamydiales bacterium]
MAKQPGKKKITAKRWAGSEEEADYLPDMRKEHKQERKIASRTDKSKFKKTDQDQLLAKKVDNKTPPKNTIRGRVLSITAQGMLVSHDGKETVCTLKGALKHKKERSKNLVTVGDFVWFEELTQGHHEIPGDGIISQVEKRRTVLSRADNLHKHSQQLIAANIDCVLITIAVVEPPLKPSLVDRYLIAAEKGGMNAIIVVNKVDLLESPDCSVDERNLFKAFVEDYKALGYKILCVSADNLTGIEDLRAEMRDQACVFSGQSGTGKTSLINAVTGLNMRTAGMINKTKKGTHTTTTTKLIPLEGGGFCVDTPGIRSFGMWELIKGEVVGYFPEMMKIGRHCKFNYCTHTHEPDCAVLKAVHDGEISIIRYESYYKLLEEET